MGKMFDVVEQWPDLFEHLDAAQRHAVVQTLAVAGHEGWSPTREQVENLTARAAGVIDTAEYRRRAQAAARRAAVTVTG